MGSLTCPKCNSNDLAEMQRIPNTDPPLYEYRCGNCDAVVHLRQPVTVAKIEPVITNIVYEGDGERVDIPFVTGFNVTPQESELVAKLEVATDPPSISIHGGYVSIPLDAVPSGTTVQVTMTYTLVVRAPDEAE